VLFVVALLEAFFYFDDIIGEKSVRFLMDSDRRFGVWADGSGDTSGGGGERLGDLGNRDIGAQ